MRYCKRCLTPDTRPRLTFDEEGVCSACKFAELKKKIDWDARKKTLSKLLDGYRRDDGWYDCIVPWSGGKDSGAIAYRLKYEFGMNPLLVTVAPQLITEEGKINRRRLLDQGFDHLLYTPNPKIHRKLSRKTFLEHGDGWMAWSQAVNTVPVRVAVSLNIPLIAHAEHESEYSGLTSDEKDARVSDFEDFAYFLEKRKKMMFGVDPREWLDDEITLKDLQPYMYPPLKEIKRVGVRCIFWSNYFRWSSYQNYLFAKDHWNFQTNLDGRTEGTFTDYDSIDDKLDGIYYYMQYIKFGFGRTIRDASRKIQCGEITREEGLKLARKYDGEFPEKYFKDFLEYNDITEEDFWKVVDSFRSPDIWEKKDGEWGLKYPPE